jgi:pimeloyl-ACP methyl ester carboxylesterase
MPTCGTYRSGGKNGNATILGIRAALLVDSIPMRAVSRSVSGLLLLVPFMSAGCAPQPVDPAFAISAASARADLKRMAAHPIALERPLVVISGFMDPGIAAISLRNQFFNVTGDRRIATISLFECFSFEQCRQKIIGVVDRAFPSDDPSRTSEVDVVGYSMGGLAARLAADPPKQGMRRLRIARLFTIDSPNQGATRAAQFPLLHPLQADMRPGSGMLTRLNFSIPPYPVFAYVRLGDKPVGEQNTQVAGNPLWWVSTLPMTNPHADAYQDPRIRADIARRLRRDPPLTSLPPAPLPPES